VKRGKPITPTQIKYPGQKISVVKKDDDEELEILQALEVGALESVADSQQRSKAHRAAAPLRWSSCCYCKGNTSR
jgi:hypothetical protein